MIQIRNSDAHLICPSQCWSCGDIKSGGESCIHYQHGGRLHSIAILVSKKLNPVHIYIVGCISGKTFSFLLSSFFPSPASTTFPPFSSSPLSSFSTPPPPPSLFLLPSPSPSLLPAHFISLLLVHPFSSLLFTLQGWPFCTQWKSSHRSFHKSL